MQISQIPYNNSIINPNQAMMMNQMNTTQQQSPLKQQQQHQQQQIQMKNVIQAPLPQLNLNPSHHNHHSQIQNGGILTVNSTMAPTNIQNQMISSTNTNTTNASALATMNGTNSTTNSTTATNASASSNSSSVLINQINYLINLPLSKEEDEVLKDYDW